MANIMKTLNGYEVYDEAARMGLVAAPALGKLNVTEITGTDTAQDYNKLTTPGTYYVESDATAKAMHDAYDTWHCPTTHGHRLFVVDVTYTTEHLMQVVVDRDGSDNTNHIYRRMYNASAKTWGAWFNHGDQVEELARQVTALRSSNVHIYGARWDGTNAKCTRLYEAAEIATDTTDFCYAGSVKTLSNPFDNIYPWNQMAMCNVDLDAYNALQPGDDIRDAVTAWKGDSDFAFDGSNGFVGVYRPQYWYKAWKDGDGIVFAIATGKIDGWAESKPYIRGMGFATQGATTSTLSCTNGTPYNNVTIASAANNTNLQAYARNTGIRLDDIYTYSAELTAFIVEYATLDSQTALGNGVSDLYYQGNYHPVNTVSASKSVELPSGFAAYCEVGANMDFGTSAGAVNTARASVTGYTTTGDHITVNLNQAVTVTDTSATYVSIHGRNNYISGSMAGKAPSGYLGSNGKSNAFYRGAIFHGNRLRYLSGIWRQQNTNNVWICTDPDKTNDYVTLDTSAATDTGLTLPNNIVSSSYISALGVIEGLGAVPVGLAASGGTSASPVGDAVLTAAAATQATVPYVGGSAQNGLASGAFYNNWKSASGMSNWAYAVYPVLPSP